MATVNLYGKVKAYAKIGESIVPAPKGKDSKESFKWVNVTNQKVGLPADIEQLLDSFNTGTSKLIATTEIISDVLNVIKYFLVNDLNPIVTAISFLVDQIISFMNSIKNSGVYILIIYPSHEMNSGTISLQELTNRPVDKNSSFPILSVQKAFELFDKSFDDKLDSNRPNTKTNLYGGGFTIFLSTDEKLLEDKKFAGMRTAMKTMVQFARFLYAIIPTQQTKELLEYFDKNNSLLKEEEEKPKTVDSSVAKWWKKNSSYKKDAMVLGKYRTGDAEETISVGIFQAVNDGISGYVDPKWRKNTSREKKDYIIDDNIFEGPDKTINWVFDKELSTKTNKAPEPNWKTYRLQDVSSSLAEIFLNIENVLNSTKKGFETASQNSQLKMVAYLEDRLREMKIIKSNIEAFKAWVDTLKALETTKMKRLVVEPQADGVNIFRRAMKNPGLENRPNPDSTVSAMVSVVGGGFLLSLLMVMLGLSEKLDYSVDPIIYDSELFRDKFGLNFSDDKKYQVFYDKYGKEIK